MFDCAVGMPSCVTKQLIVETKNLEPCAYARCQHYQGTVYLEILCNILVLACRVPRFPCKENEHWYECMRYSGNLVHVRTSRGHRAFIMHCVIHAF
jgi:hypothetical protein